MSNLNASISIVIPFFNEEESLNILLPRLYEVLSRVQCDWQLLLVDDKSTDKSLKIARSLARGNTTVIENPMRGGQTGCYKAAFPAATGEFIIRMDADLQDSPEDLPLFISKVEEGSDLVMGLRECRKHSRSLRIAAHLYDLLILILFNSPLHSNSGSYVCFRRSLVLQLPWYKNDHRYLPLICLSRGAKNVSEVLVRHTDRKFGESKYNPLRKLVLGIPEVVLFLTRLRLGCYENKIINPIMDSESNPSAPSKTQRNGQHPPRVQL